MIDPVSASSFPPHLSGILALRSGNVTFQGYTSSPDTRGTVQILWSCVFTIFLSLWSTACVHYPARGESSWRVLQRKLLLFVLALFGPEFMFAAAYNQWISAHRSVRQFRDLLRTATENPKEVDHSWEARSRRVLASIRKLALRVARKMIGLESVEESENGSANEWTNAHAFFADGGGFILECPSPGKYSFPPGKCSELDPIIPPFPAFPVNARQIYYLVNNGYIDMPTITKRQLEDRNKRSLTLRLITLAQIMWFFISFSYRLIRDLPIAALELTTVAYVSCSVVTAALWFDKPDGIRCHEVLRSKIPLEEIVKDARLAPTSPVYYNNPLDFAGRQNWLGNRVWANYLGILDHFGICDTHAARPQQRFGSSDTIPLVGRHKVVSMIVTGVYSGIFLFAWDHTFPTPVERTLWRAASMSVFASLFAVFVVDEMGSRFVPYLDDRFDLSAKYAPISSRGPRRRRPDRWTLAWILARMRNNTRYQLDEFDVPIYVGLTLYIVGAFYIWGRLVVTCLDLAELRSLPSGVYEVPSWLSLLPHA